MAVLRHRRTVFTAERRGLGEANLIPIEGSTAGFPVYMKDMGDGNPGSPRRLIVGSPTDDVPGIFAMLKG